MSRITPDHAGCRAAVVQDVSVGVLLALALVLAMGFAYSCGLWMLLSPTGPMARHRRRRDIDETVARLSADLDRKLAELISRG